jgi:hypothetical protein
MSELESIVILLVKARRTEIREEETETLEKETGPFSFSNQLS